MTAALAGVAFPKLLASTTITTAVTTVGDAILIPVDASAVELQVVFTYGSSGTTAKLYLQTSLDQGATWIDIACASFTTATATKLYAIDGAGGSLLAVAPGDATLTADTVLNGVLGEYVRTKLVTTGTYAGGTTIAASAVFKPVSSGSGVTVNPGSGATSLGKVEDAAHTSGDVGVMMLGVYNAAGGTASVNTDGDYSYISTDIRGRVLTAMGGTNANTDGLSATVCLPKSENANTSGALVVVPHLYNSAGNTFDRQRANVEATVLASAARTTLQSTDVINYNGSCVVVMLSVTAYTSGGLTLAIRGKNPISSAYYQLHANFVKVQATGEFVYVIGLSALTAAAGGITAVAQAPVPRTFNVSIAVDDATSITYSISASILL